jgi:hypothetical protein
LDQVKLLEGVKRKGNINRKREANHRTAQTKGDEAHMEIVTISII